MVSIRAYRKMSTDEKQKKNIKLTSADRILLISLVDNHREIIKNAKKDAATIARKDKAWDDITVGFNANPTVSGHRTAAQLRKAWSNLCSRTKEEVAEAKKSRLKTGGGPPEADISIISANVAGVLGDSLFPLDNPHDGDAGHHGEQVIKISSEETEEIKPLQVTPSHSKGRFFFGQRRVMANRESEAAKDIVEMRRREHEATLEKIAWETAYWRQKFAAEFGEEKAAEKAEEFENLNFKN